MSIEPTTIFQYDVGSGEMRYIIVTQREIILEGDAQRGFRIFGQMIDGGGNDTIDLSEMLLEDAMTNDVHGERVISERLVDNFSEGLGQSLSAHIKAATLGECNTLPFGSAEKQAALTIACILDSLNAPYTATHVGTETWYEFADCPLCAAAERTHINEAALAHHALDTLLQSAIHAISPELSGLAHVRHRVEAELVA